MGWVSSPSWSSSNDVIASLRVECFGPDHILEAEARTCYGKHWWTVVRCKYSGGRPDVAVVILFKLDTLPGGDWGYKDISEEMGPYDYDCPVKLLDIAAAISDFCDGDVRAS